MQHWANLKGWRVGLRIERGFLFFWEGLVPKARFIAVLCFVAALSAGQKVDASTILSGEVSFDNVTQLYTYNYTIDNTSGPIAIRDLNILIDTSQDSVTPLWPVPNSSPAGWGFSGAFAGTSADPPLNEFGAFFGWSGQPPVSIGSTLSGFSFSVAIAPTSSLANNYYLYSPDYSGGPPNIVAGGIVEFGHVVAPDFATPLPAALPLFASGLGALGLLGWRRKRKAV